MLVTLRRLGALACVLPLLLAAACGSEPAGPAAKQPGQLQIVVAFYPFQFIAERVAGDNASVSSLTQPGAEPHDIELTPKQVASVSTASLVIYEKTFQAAVDEAVEQSGNANVLDVATVVPLQPLAKGEEEPAEEDSHGGLDPHIWLDPTNVSAITKAVAEQLTSLDPTNAADYGANAATLEDQLGDLDQAFKTRLANCQRTEFITTHEAFGYLARKYQLTQIGISGLSPDAEPSPARIAEVQRQAKEHQLTTIFYETLVSPAIAESIAGDLGLATDVLDPVEGITNASRGQDYLAVMTSNLEALRKAGGCG